MSANIFKSSPYLDYLGLNIRSQDYRMFCYCSLLSNYGISSVFTNNHRSPNHLIEIQNTPFKNGPMLLTHFWRYLFLPCFSKVFPCVIFQFLTKVGSNTVRVVSKYRVFSGPYSPVFSPDTENKGQKKLRVWKLLTQCIIRPWKNYRLLFWFCLTFICGNVFRNRPSKIFQRLSSTNFT